MSVTTLDILQPGLLSTVQDRGRYGHQRYGVPVSGAMDEFSLRMANLMAGNDQGAAAIEVTVVGPRIEFSAPTWIAITGADISAELNGSPVPMWESVSVQAGGVLSFGELRDGMRAYIAVRGGVDAPVVMGSRSTYVKGRFGGLEGRPLRAGDRLSTLPVEGAAFSPKRLPRGYTAPVYGGTHRLRVMLGPQDDAFSSEAISTFLRSRYRALSESDRMGYTLEGPKIAHRLGADIVSDGNPPGAVQVPGDGVPRILLADRGTTGGYAKIATVITADLSTIAQALPGQAVTFRQATPEEAMEALLERESVLRAVERQGQVPVMAVSLDGAAFEAETEDGHPLARTEPLTGEAESVERRVGVTAQGERFVFHLRVETEF